MPGKKILVVDDELDFVDAVKIRLEAVGYEIVSANDGHEGVAKAKKEMPMLILLDVVMPRSNGFEALSRLKTDSATAHIPVIIITAKSDAEYVLDAGKLGAADYIMKPVSMQTLLEHVRKYV